MDTVQKAELVSLLTQTEIDNVKIYLNSLESTILSFRNFQAWAKVKPILTPILKIKAALEDYPGEDKSKYQARKPSVVDDPIIMELKTLVSFIIWDCCSKLTLLSQFLSTTKAQILINTVGNEIKQIKAHLAISDHTENLDNRPPEQIKKEIEAVINELKNERRELSVSRRLRDVTSLDENVISKSRNKESLPHLTNEKNTNSSPLGYGQRATEVSRPTRERTPWVSASTLRTHPPRMMLLSAPTRQDRISYLSTPSSPSVLRPSSQTVSEGKITSSSPTTTNTEATVTCSRVANTNLSDTQKKTKRNIFQKIADHLNSVALRHSSRPLTIVKTRKDSTNSAHSKSSGEDHKDDASTQRPTSSHSSPPKIASIRPKSPNRRSPSSVAVASDGKSESSGKSPNRSPTISPANSTLSSPRSSGEPHSPRFDDESEGIHSKDSSNPINKFNLETRMRNFDKYICRYSTEIMKHEDSAEGTPRSFDRKKRRAAIYKRTADSYPQLFEQLTKETRNDDTKSAASAADMRNIWDEEDSSDNIRYQTNDKGENQIVAASLNKLIQHLTLAAGCDPKFTNTFLLTYKSFTTPSIFLEKLKQRYRGPPSLTNSTSSSTMSTTPTTSNSSIVSTTPTATSPAISTTPTATSSIVSTPPTSTVLSTSPNFETLKNYCIKEGGNDKDSESAILTSIQLRVVNVLKRWLDMSFLDFNDKLIAEVFEFVDEMRRDRNYHLAEIIDNVLISKLVGLTKNQKRTFDTAPPPPIIPKTERFTFDDLDEIEFARQITLRDFELFSSIQASEFLNKAWQEPSLQYRSPRVLKMIRQFNTLSMWVAGVILRCENLKKRVKTMTKFIDVAWELLKLNNFHSMMSIAAGVNHFAVHRLKATRSELPKSAKNKMQKLEALMSSHLSYKEYRTALKTANPPAIPHLGMYLSDLVFIEDGSADKIDGLINFRKRRLVAQQIEEIQQFQQIPYNFAVVDSIQEFLNNLPEEDGEELYQLSLSIEPKASTSVAPMATQQTIANTSTGLSNTGNDA